MNGVLFRKNIIKSL